MEMQGWGQIHYTDTLYPWDIFPQVVSRLFYHEEGKMESPSCNFLGSML